MAGTVFSMASAAFAHLLEITSRVEVERPKALPLGTGTVGLTTTLAAIDEVLPDGGLPRGAVVELASASGLGRATTVALAACAAAQREARLRSGDPATVGAWCAFIDP